MPSSDPIDWTRATIKITAPVQHTAMETVQELEVPLVQLPSLLQDLIDAGRTNTKAKDAQP